MMRQINLFNPALLPKKHQFSAATMLQASALLILSLAGVVWFGQLQISVLQKQADANVKQLASLQAQLQKINTEFAPRQKNPQVEQDLNKAERQLSALQDMQNWLRTATLGNGKGYAEHMTALARQSQTGLWLTGFDLEDAGQSIALQGRTTQADLIPAYIQRLGTEPVFRGKSFDTLNVQRIKDEVEAENPAPAVAPDNSASATVGGEKKTAANSAANPAPAAPVAAGKAAKKTLDQSRILEFSLQGISLQGVSVSAAVTPTANKMAEVGK